MADLLMQKELIPKDILQFVETRAERAIEVLREMIAVPDYECQIAAAASPLTNITWNHSTTGLAKVAAQQGPFNG